MKKSYFYVGICLLVLFEIANVYFIMPMPFSQRARSIDIAYRLHSWRWIFRAVFGAMIVAGAAPAWRVSGWRRPLVPISLVIAALIAYAMNFPMSAGYMFLAPTSLVMQPPERNSVKMSQLVVGIEMAGEARAYPVQFIGYHHQVRDTVAGKPVMVTFCTVCRTGRVLDPVVDGKAENFRLVGMDHFNAMFEDQTTGSWWRQATGAAIVGPRKGKVLTELESQQVTLAEWLALHPKSLIMQPDPALKSHYTKTFDYETGASRKSLTGTDTVSWHDKAWVVGIATNGESKAYDWNRLRRETVINDVLGGRSIVLALAPDHISFVAYVRPDAKMPVLLRGDSLVAGANAYDLSGRGAKGSLTPLNASQEFWHSWRTFHPGTKTY
jgi:Protein of unknown function (DUF3179)